MKHSLFLLVLSFSLVSCGWESTTTTKPLQYECNKKLNGYTTEQLLIYLGQPQETAHDTLDSVPVTEFCYSDTAVLKEFCSYSSGFGGEKPYMSVYLMNGTVYSVKTNMVRSLTTPHKKTSDFTVIVDILVFLIMIVLSALFNSRLSVLENSLLNSERHISRIRSDLNHVIRRADILKTNTDIFQKRISELESDLEQNSSSFEKLYDLLAVSPDLHNLLNRPLDDTDISYAVCDRLKKMGIQTLGELCSCSDVLRHLRAGYQTKSKLKVIVKRMGLKLNHDYKDAGYPLWSLEDRTVHKEGAVEDKETVSGSDAAVSENTDNLVEEQK